MPLSNLPLSSVADRLLLMNPAPASRHGVAVADARTLDLKVVSAPFAAMHGYNVNAMIGRAAATVFDTALCQQLSEHIQDDALADNYRQKTINKRKDGSSLSADVEISIIKNSFGAPYLCLLHVYPSNLTHAPSRISRVPEQGLRQIMHVLGHEVMNYDNQCRCIFANAAAQRSLRRPQRELLGQTPVGLLGSRAGHLQQAIATVFRNGEAMTIEWPAPEQSQHVATGGAITLVPEYDAQGQVTSVVTVANELAELRETRHQLEHSRLLMHSMVNRHDADIEAERKHIAREIHDEIGQILTALRIKLDTLHLQYGGDNVSMAASLQSIRQLVNHAFGVVRNVAQSLRPAALDMGLVAALEWMVQRFRDDNAIACELAVDETEVTLDDERAVAVFRIVQESLTNIARHAHANQVRILLGRYGDHYELLISDDGDGFDQNARRNNSYGLIGIGERAFILGGELTIMSTQGAGTTLIVRFPCKERYEGKDLSQACEWNEAMEKKDDPYIDRR